MTQYPSRPAVYEMMPLEELDLVFDLFHAALTREELRMGTVSVNPPKTPVTEGSNGIAAATVPNVCKMPGPPAPFVPTPLPNIGKSSDSPKGYSRSVTIEGKAVAIRGASFGSQGDMASKGTGGGVVSSNTHGPTKFVGPGSMNVQIEGKNVQLLGDPMLNNCGPSGSPANAATLAGVLQNAAVAAAAKKNPSSEDVCGAGKHVEDIHYPKVPKSEWHPSKRIAVMKKVAATAEDHFEIAAAEHNIKNKSIQRGEQISRKLTPEEKAAGYHADDQKVMAVCRKCGFRREIDHAPSPKSSVEAKSTADAVKGGDQKNNNQALVNRGFSVAYKSPPLDPQKAADLRSRGFELITIS
jgi:hypothetical protein